MVKRVLMAVALVLVIFWGQSMATEKSRVEQSRQFEMDLKKAHPELTDYIWATHVTDDGLEVQLSMMDFYNLNLDKGTFYKKVYEFWQKTAPVLGYSGKVKFMLFYRTVETID